MKHSNPPPPAPKKGESERRRLSKMTDEKSPAPLSVPLAT